MRLVFLLGTAASGKYTVGRELSALTGLPLFHNHLIVDALLAVFPFGSPDFVRLREQMWLQILEAASRAGRSLIFTFQPEPTVSLGFADNVANLVRSAGGRTDFVRLIVSREEQERRVVQPSRAVFGKLVSLDLLRDLRDGFDASERAMPPLALEIDTEAASPGEAAAHIAGALGLSASCGAD